MDATSFFNPTGQGRNRYFPYWRTGLICNSSPARAETLSPTGVCNRFETEDNICTKRIILGGHEVNYRKDQWVLAAVLSALLALMVSCGGKKTKETPPPPPAPVTATLSANPASIQSGQSSTLTWSTQGATEVNLQGNKVDPNGSQTVTPTQTTTYQLAANGPGGNQTATATVTVVQPTPT